MRLPLRRRALTVANTFASWTGWEWGRNAAFGAAGLGLLLGLHAGFVRVLAFLVKVPLIGELLLWKLTAVMLMMTFSMVLISSLLTSLTTLFYSYDLKFLMKAPVSLRDVFLDKALESAFLASWTIGLVLVPYVLAVRRALGLGWAFPAAFAAALPPLLALAAACGVAFTLLLLRLFPSSRTRDVVWALSSLSLTVVYALIRLAQPERLARPDALRLVAGYLGYLQAPTARYLPSWWLAESLTLAARGAWRGWALRAAGLWAAALAVYAGLARLAGRIYFDAYSGAQEGALRRRRHPFDALPEARLGLSRPSAALLWKERVLFFRDVKHWSQIMLTIGLVFVYLFSIRRLPMDSPELRSLISFLNIGMAGFVIAALGLRFTFPAISLEGRAWWVLRSAPVALPRVARQKFVFSAVPTALLAAALGVMTNVILEADRFTFAVTLGALLVAALAITAMGVGFGALFPRFTVENIHQVESSLGGFVYMAACLFYVGATIASLAPPMQMHFARRFGGAAWDWRVAGLSAAGWLALNLVAFVVPWTLGLRALERYEET